MPRTPIGLQCGVGIFSTTAFTSNLNPVEPEAPNLQQPAASSDGNDAIVWQPLTWPTTAELAFQSSASKQLDSLRSAWQVQRQRLEEQNPDRYTEFLGRLLRRWAIETGIIERLYDLDEGVTETLVEFGFRADLVQRNDTGMPADQLLAMLNDHVAAGDMVKSLISNQRPFSVHFIRELHQLITRTQEVTDARTSLGDRVKVEMEHGVFRQSGAERLCLDGVVREYASPEQIASEMDRLVDGFQMLEGEPPAIVAAWLHHRFTQVHPFQDGNGRVARALANMVFIRGGLFPLMLGRSDREGYIRALDQADKGDLADLTNLFAEIEAQTVLQALSIAKEEEERGRVAPLESVLDHLVGKVGRRVKDRESVLRGVNPIALVLRDRGVEHVSRAAATAAARLEEVGVRIRIFRDVGGPELASDHYWRLQLVDLAQEFQYWFNKEEAQYWFKILMVGAPVTLRFVVSVHHVGHDITGVMRAVAFCEFEVQGHKEESASGPSTDTQPDKKFSNCTATVFSITWQDDLDDKWREFASWIDEGFSVAVRRWADLL